MKEQTQTDSESEATSTFNLLDMMFEDRIPGFTEGEGTWPTLPVEQWNVKVKGGYPNRLVWRTDQATGVKTVDIHTDEFVVNGFGERQVAPQHVVSRSGDEEPKIFVGTDYDPSDITSRPSTQIPDSDTDAIGTELDRAFAAWTRMIDDEEIQPYLIQDSEQGTE